MEALLGNATQSATRSIGDAFVESWDVIHGFADQVMSATQRAVPVHVLSDFVETVTWDEPFILGLICAQLSILSAVLLLRRKLVAQLVIFCCICLAVFAAEPLNTWGSRNWSLFASQNYFDKNGLFAVIFYAGPLLFTCHVVLINLSIRTVQMAGKTARLKRRAGANHAANNNAANPKKNN